MAEELLNDAGMDLGTYKNIPDGTGPDVSGHQTVTPDPGAPPVNSTPPIPPPPEVTSITVDGTAIPVEDIKAGMGWVNHLRLHPDKASDIAKVLATQPAAPTPDQLQAQAAEQARLVAEEEARRTRNIPPDFDDSDPFQKFVVDRITQMDSAQQQFMQAQQTYVQQQMAQRVATDTNAALERFKATHPSLSSTEIDQVRQASVQTGILPGVIQAHQGRESEGIFKALEASLYQIPDIRNKVIAEQTGTPAPPIPPDPNRQRQSKLSALGGTSGSVPRTEPPAPRIDSDHAMKEAVAEALTPWWQANHQGS